MATILFGDSIAKGITYSKQKLTLTDEPIVDALNQLYGISIDNRSVYGQTLKRIHDKHIIEKTVSTLDLQEQHYVVIAVGGNDADYDWKLIGEYPDLHHEPKTPLPLFEELLTNYVIYLKDKGIIPILLTTVPLISKRYFDEVVSKAGNPENILKFFNQDIEMIFRHHEAYSHVITKIGYSYDCILIDIRTTLLYQPNYNDYISSDGIHPNQMGYDRILSIIKERMQLDTRLISWKDSHIEHKKSVII
jgi:hypothetical protein